MILKRNFQSNIRSGNLISSTELMTLIGLRKRVSLSESFTLIKANIRNFKTLYGGQFCYQLSWWYQITLLYFPTDVAWPQFSKKLPPSWFQIGLAVGDIDTIRKTAALERYTSQVCRIQRICYHFCEEPVVIWYNVMKKILFLWLNSYRNWISWITSDSQDIPW